jgi:hypothetical protein
MFVSSDEIEPEIYFWNSTSTLNALRVDFFLYTEFWTLNRVGASSTAGTGSSRTGESVIVALDVDDFWLRY